MNFEKYQKEAREFAIYKNPLYPVLGLAEEAGEVVGKWAKALRGDGVLDRKSIKKELGDVLWMLSACADEMGFSLEDIAKENIVKLTDRANRNKIKGEGDNR